MPRFDIHAPIHEQVRLSPDIYRITLHAPQIAAKARPGQFCMIQPCSGSFDPLLRRPLSIHRKGNNGSISFLYKVLGKGTELLSRHTRGESIKVLGPLGRPFRNTHDGSHILVGGGLGIAPLLFLAESLEAGEVAIVLGGATRLELPAVDRFSDLPHRLHLATEDGSLGQKGLVTDLLEGLLQKKSLSPQVYACGPWPMLKAVYGLCRIHNLSCQVSLEERMACGIGLCLGCAVQKSDSSGYLHICKDGPVINADMVDWEPEP